MEIVVFWVVSIVVSTMIGSGKGKAGAGFLLGLLLSWLGVIIIAVMKPVEKAEDTE